MDILNPQTEEEQREFFRRSFSRFGDDWEKIANKATLIFDRPVWWPVEIIVVEYEGRRRYYPARAEIGRGLADASSCLMYEITEGDKYDPGGLFRRFWRWITKIFRR